MCNSPTYHSLQRTCSLPDLQEHFTLYPDSDSTSPQSTSSSRSSSPDLGTSLFSPHEQAQSGPNYPDRTRATSAHEAPLNDIEQAAYDAALDAACARSVELVKNGERALSERYTLSEDEEKDIDEQEGVDESRKDSGVVPKPPKATKKLHETLSLAESLIAMKKQSAQQVRRDAIMMDGLRWAYRMRMEERRLGRALY